MKEMRYFKDDSGGVHAFDEKQVTDGHVPEFLIEMKIAEINEHLASGTAESDVPHRVSRAQGKAALVVAGVWDQVLEYVAGIADPTEKALAEIALHDAQFWQRNSPFLARVAEALNMTAKQLDELFVKANQIQL